MTSTENKIDWEGEARIKESEKPRKGTQGKTTAPESCISPACLLSFLLGEFPPYPSLWVHSGTEGTDLKPYELFPISVPIKEELNAKMTKQAGGDGREDWVVGLAFVFLFQ